MDPYDVLEQLSDVLFHSMHTDETKLRYVEELVGEFFIQQREELEECEEY